MVGVGKVLPEGWRERASSESPIFKGEKLTVFGLAREDLLRTKLLAIVSKDRGADAVQDLEDLKAMKITRHEVRAEVDWLHRAEQVYGSSKRERRFYEEFVKDTVIDFLEENSDEN